jgi:hypothetical protein
MVEEIVFHLFDLALVNAHILHWKKYTKKFRLHKFMEEVTKGLVTEVGKEITEQSQKNSVGRDNFVHRTPATGTK